MGTYRQLVAAGTTTRDAARLTGVCRATAARQKHRRSTPATPVLVAPANALTEVERAQVLAVLGSDEFVDSPPLQVYATLLDRGVYLCSVSTMYRVLAEHAQVRDRRRQARHRARARPELVATGPGQVYTWDITKLAGPVKGCYYDAYVMIDIYSRYIVGAHVHAHESGVLAQEMMKQIFGIHGVPQVVHADRGTSMTSKTVAALLDDLNVTRSHSRPKVSNDNPYSEAWFKTLKYAPSSPNGSAPSPMPAPSSTGSSPGTTTSITTPASAFTPQPTSTTAWPPPKPPSAPRPWPRPEPPTRTGSTPRPHPRSSTCPRQLGSTPR